MDNIESLIIAQTLKNEEYLEIGYKTHENWGNILSAIGDDFIKTLISKLSVILQENFPNLHKDWEIVNTNSGDSINLRIKNPDWKENIEFGFVENSIEEKKEGLYFFISSKKSNREKIHAEIITIIEEGESNEYGWWNWVKEPYNLWYYDLKVLKEFAFPTKLPNAINYFTEKLVLFAKIIDEKIITNQKEK